MLSSQESIHVNCPICCSEVPVEEINQHIDTGCPPSGNDAPTSSQKHRHPDQHQFKFSTKTKAPIFCQKRKASDSAAQGTFLPSSFARLTDRTQHTVESSSSSAPSSKRPRHRIQESLDSVAPLADRLRPQSLDDYVGQEAVVGKGTLLRGLFEKGSAGSLILWGPPGSGKTTLARIIAHMTGSVTKELSAMSAGSAEIRAVFEEAKSVLQLTNKRTVLFLDEIQRFNKSQQDIFLPYAEKGWIQLIAATTENPSFKVNGALLSRCRVVVLKPLTDANIIRILQDGISRISPYSASLQGSSDQSSSSSVAQASPRTDASDTSMDFPGIRLATDAVLKYIATLSTGDARAALNLLELVLKAPCGTDEEMVFKTLKETTMLRYDRSGDDRYDMISALHKSLRGSDGSASMYWLARMLTAGEDPLYVARRLVVVASEDVGLADSHALPLATATYAACQNIGMPECRINLAHCVAYLAEAPKSTRAYEAYGRAEESAKKDPTLPVPLVVRNAPTGLMKTLGYGATYAYNPSYLHPVINTYLPPELAGEKGKFLKEENDLSEKAWDEELLVRWEREVNGGTPWKGRAEKG